MDMIDTLCIYGLSLKKSEVVHLFIFRADNFIIDYLRKNTRIEKIVVP